MSVGDWQDVGAAEPPVVSDDYGISARQLAEGNGPPIEAGDLVKLRVIVRTPPINEFHRPLVQTPEIAWVWTGRDEGDSWQWGHPGTDALRSILIGRRSGERFEVTRAAAVRGYLRLPRAGLIEPPLADNRLSYTDYVDNRQYYDARRWQPLDLERPGYEPADAEIEVLSVCPGAQRQRRTGELRQWGLRMPWGGSRSFRAVRRGILHWGAVDADCPAPDGHFRLEVGPFYFPELGDPKRLYLWELSYTRLRPPSEHPEEWLPR